MVSFGSEQGVNIFAAGSVAQLLLRIVKNRRLGSKEAV
jgi:hypothetical protein